MKPGILFLILGAMGLMCAIVAERNYAQWVGVWQGELEGQPGVTLTLGRDTGDLQGTIVFNVVSREGGEARVIGHDAHTLTHVQLDNNTLAFHVFRLGDARELHLTMASPTTIRPFWSARIAADREQPGCRESDNFVPPLQ